MHETRLMLGLALASSAALYALLALAATVRFRRRSRRASPAAAHAAAPRPPVTVLKPLCGAESGLEEQLRSFCVQDYPAVQLLFGARDADDPALAVVRRLQRAFPQVDIDVVIDPTLHGCNRKISNLMNMLPRARHPCLVFTDSDIGVTRDWLARVVAPLADPQVGIVTCAYFGRAAAAADGRSTLASRLGAMFINEWFTPSVLLAAAFGARGYVSGATIAMRATVLADIGGLAALADTLADDYRLGELVRRRGLTIRLSDCAVRTTVDEPTVATLCRHELRWLRTIQSVQPLGFACCFPSFAVPLAVVGAALAGFGTVALTILVITAGARLVLHYFGAAGSWQLRCRQLALLPLRDALLAALWAASFRKREIVWREQRFGVGQDGSLHRVG